VGTILDPTKAALHSVSYHTAQQLLRHTTACCSAAQVAVGYENAVCYSRCCQAQNAEEKPSCESGTYATAC
jgi:hypothetical protein